MCTCIWKYMSEQVGNCTLYNSIWYSIQPTRKTVALKQDHCRIMDGGKQNETVVHAERCHWKPAAPPCGKRKCISTHLKPEFLLKQTAAGRFTSSVIKAQTFGCEPPSSLFSATMDRHPSFETGNRKSNVWHFNNGAASLKSCSCSRTTFPAERSPTCLINRSPLEAGAASALTQWMRCTAGCFRQLLLNS